jgi:pseudaminic acid synthase
MFTIANHEISKEAPTFIIAELSANHYGKIENAKALIKAAKGSGADAVKLQTYTPDTITLNCDNDYFKIKQDTIWDGRILYDLYEEAYTPYAWHEELFEYANSLNILIFSSPFDESAVQLLESLDTPAYKIASFEITDINLIRECAKTQKPIIISTGIADESDITLAIQTCKAVGNHNIVLLKCTSAYPAPLESMNLTMIPDLSSRFDVLSGLSDHTSGSLAPVVAVTLGATVIEKHFILDRNSGGVDAGFSLEPAEFKAMVQSVRDAEQLIGKVDYSLNDKKQKAREFSRSLFISQDIKAGEVFTKTNIRSVRPGFGMHPKHLEEVLGKKATRDLTFGKPLKKGDVL